VLTKSPMILRTAMVGSVNTLLSCYLYSVFSNRWPISCAAHPSHQHKRPALSRSVRTGRSKTGPV